MRLHFYHRPLTSMAKDLILKELKVLYFSTLVQEQGGEGS